jgi:hypothetical protein
MPGLTARVLLQDIKKLETEALIVGFYENVRPLKNLAGELDWLLCGSLSGLILNKRVRGTVGELALLTSRGKLPAQKIFMVGLGPKEAVSPATISSITKKAVSGAVSAGVKNAAIECFPVFDMPYDISVPAIRRGISDGAAGNHLEITMLAPDAAAYEKISRLMKDRASV